MTKTNLLEKKEATQALPTAETVILPQEKLPPQPLPQRKFLFWQKTAVLTVPAVVVRKTGVYVERITEKDLPLDAKLWTFKEQYVYSLQYDGTEYQCFEPTGESKQKPEFLWRAIKAAPIRKVFTIKNRGLEKLNTGLGLTFLIICIVTLFVIGNMVMGG